MKRSLLCYMFVFLAVQSLWGQAPYGLTERVPNTSLKLHSVGDKLTSKQIERVFTNLVFNQPTFLTNAGDGSNRIFVSERRGVVYVFPNDPSVTVGGRKTFLDIHNKVQINVPSGEAGFLSMAFHPDYAQNGKFYISYTDTIGGNIRVDSLKFGAMMSTISEVQVSAGNPDAADASSERILLELEQPWDNHNGGQLAFGNDGYLYLSLGDGRAPNDTLRNGQNPQNWFGTMLRIDVDHQDPPLQYRIPPDNPFVGNVDGWKEEIFAYGLRNPWRFSIDHQTGTIWLADVGEKRAEEIDIITSGSNYGWSVMEGFQCFRDVGCDTTGLTPPIYEYTRDIGTTITGGYVYRGSLHQSMRGLYVYGDYGSRAVWGLHYAPGEPSTNVQISTCPQPFASFGVDEANELYIVGYNGANSQIFRFKDNNDSSTSVIPATISSSGLYADMQNKVVSPGIIPYGVNAPFWSDGSFKTRYLALPDTTRIVFSSDNSWQFPESSVLVKNFFLEMEKGNPLSRKLIETRFLVKRWQEAVWDGYSYEWDDTETDASLLDGSKTKEFTVADAQAPGGQRVVSHYYPSRTECNICHTPVAGYVLGVRTAQLNGQFQYETVSDHQLRSLNHIGMFTQDIGEDYSAFPALVNPLDTTKSLDDRARSYLDANCSQCHRPGGPIPTPVPFDLRASVPLSGTNVINGVVWFGNLGVTGAKIVKPGSSDSSVLYLRMSRRGADQMPPLATIAVDSDGSEVIQKWIQSLSTAAVHLPTSGVPSEFRLYPAYPNPFNPSCVIRFDIAAPVQARITVFSILGNEVVELTNRRYEPGSYAVEWRGTDVQQRLVASGLYLYSIDAGPFHQTGKMVLLK